MQPPAPQPHPSGQSWDSNQPHSGSGAPTPYPRTYPPQPYPPQQYPPQQYPPQQYPQPHSYETSAHPDHAPQGYLQDPQPQLGTAQPGTGATPGPGGLHAGGRTRFIVVLGATAVALVLHLVLLLVFAGAPPSAEALGQTMGRMFLGAAVSSGLVWLAVRRRTLPFWLLLVIAAAAYFLLRVPLGG